MQISYRVSYPPKTTYKSFLSPRELTVSTKKKKKVKKLVKILREIHLPSYPFKINLPVISMRFQKSKKQFLQTILQKKREDKRQLPHRHPTTLLTMIRESDGSKKPLLS